MFSLPSPPSLIACGMQIEHKWPGKSSQMNDTSGTQKIDTWEVVPDEGSQGPFFLHPSRGWTREHSQRR